MTTAMTPVPVCPQRSINNCNAAKTRRQPNEHAITGLKDASQLVLNMTLSVIYKSMSASQLWMGGQRIVAL